MINVKINGLPVDWQSISINKYRNRVSMADLEVPIQTKASHFNKIQITQNNSVLFNGIINKPEKTTEADRKIQKIDAYDPLFKLQKLQFGGGFSGYITDLIDILLDGTDVINNVQLDNKVNLRYESKTNRYAVLKEAFSYCKALFTYSHYNNELREDATDYGDKMAYTVVSWKNRTLCNEKINTDIVNVLKITNEG